MISMFTLNDILSQALNQHKTILSEQPTGCNVINMGVKIQKFNERIEILNMGKGGSYYKECNPIEYSYFKESGWNIGCVKLADPASFKLDKSTEPNPASWAAVSNPVTLP